MDLLGLLPATVASTLFLGLAAVLILRRAAGGRLEPRERQLVTLGRMLGFLALAGVAALLVSLRFANSATAGALGVAAAGGLALVALGAGALGVLSGAPWWQHVAGVAAFLAAAFLLGFRE